MDCLLEKQLTDHTNYYLRPHERHTYELKEQELLHVVEAKELVCVSAAHCSGTDILLGVRFPSIFTHWPWRCQVYCS